MIDNILNIDNETDKKLENIITSDKTFHQEDGTDKKAPRKSKNTKFT